MGLLLALLSDMVVEKRGLKVIKRSEVKKCELKSRIELSGAHPNRKEMWCSWMDGKKMRKDGWQGWIYVSADQTIKLGRCREG